MSSIICSIISLALIVKIRVWNGFLKIIVTLNVCQIVYSLQFYLDNASDYSYSDDQFQASYFLSVFGGSGEIVTIVNAAPSYKTP
jgi:hypothetical protein